MQGLLERVRVSGSEVDGYIIWRERNYMEKVMYGERKLVKKVKKVCVYVCDSE